MNSLKKITLDDKAIFDKFLRSGHHLLSAYSFQNIFIWKDLFDIYWMIIDDALCIFFEDPNGFFMHLPPLGTTPTAEMLGKIFDLLQDRNASKDSPLASRIANIEEADIPAFSDLGYKCVAVSSDYISFRESLASLEGNHFKAKRACFNHFIKNNKFEYADLKQEHGADCLALYNYWMTEKRKKKRSKVFFDMMQDNFIALNVLFENFQQLEIRGKIIRMNGALKAFTLGFMLNWETFCIQYEISDLSIKSLAQFIFSSFCRELDCRFINVMDDSGMEELRKVKLSYHPEKIVHSYTTARRNF